MRVGDVPIGNGAPLALISGLNVIESEDDALKVATELSDIASRCCIPVIFKASFDKANRSSRDAYRGPGLEKGLRVLERVKAESGLPVLTDVHEPSQAAIVAEVADCLQIPAFLCRQTDLIAACAQTGKALNIKKGQFVSPADIALAVQKAQSFGATDVLLTERGTSFGYRDLVVDMRGLREMRRAAPVCFDATHSAQLPGAGDGVSAGDREMVAPLARAAVAVGIDALFVEVHPNPVEAPCDGLCQLTPPALERLLYEVLRIAAALESAPER
jgi:2-dehydro-3-deoxyphosphooctonate aldolase (KDO 8-P synthase)